MPYADPKRAAEAAKERKKKWRAKQRAEAFGPEAPDQRGKHGKHPKASAQHRWQPGSRIGSTGHVKVRVGRGHPLADPNGWAYEHVVVWVSAGNHRPGPSEVLHHINEDKTDNRLENLQLMTRADHNRLHTASRSRCPKTGRLLDSREWNQFPGGAG